MVKMILPSLSFHSSQGTKLTAMKSMVSFRCHLNSVAVPGAVCARARLQEFSQCWVPALAMHKEDKFYLEHTHTHQWTRLSPSHSSSPLPPAKEYTHHGCEGDPRREQGGEGGSETNSNPAPPPVMISSRETVWAPASTASCETEENM